MKVKNIPETGLFIRQIPGHFHTLGIVKCQHYCWYGLVVASLKAHDTVMNKIVLTLLSLVLGVASYVSKTRHE